MVYGGFIVNKILKLLENNAKLSAKEIAVMLDMKEQEVAEEIKKFEEKGIIVKYKTVINKELINATPNVRALIEVSVSPQKSVGFDAIAERIYKLQEVSSCYLLSGGFDLLVIVEGKDINTVAKFVSEKLACMDDVLKTSTHFILKKYKENGDILFGPKPDKRLSITP